MLSARPQQRTAGWVVTDAVDRGGMMSRSQARTLCCTAVDIAPGVSLETFVLMHRAIQKREQVWGYCKGEGVRVCPHALGWRGDDAYVLGLVLRGRRERADEGAWGWLMEWRWIPLADFDVPSARKDGWVTCPREHRPSTDFLTQVTIEAE
jgi:hypothetical protein